VLPPLLALAPRRAVDRIVRGWCRCVLRAAGCRLRVEGLAHLAGAGPVVLAANHASYVDALALLAGIPVDFRFVAKRELLRTPLVAAVIRSVGHLTVERADVSRSVADAGRVAAALRAGRSLLFFPEGTFRRPAGLLPFRLGAFKAAVEAARPVIPVAIRGTRDVLPADSWWPRPGPITLVIGPPVPPGGDAWRDIVRLRDRVREAIEWALAAGAEASAS